MAVATRRRRRTGIEKSGTAVTKIENGPIATVMASPARTTATAAAEAASTTMTSELCGLAVCASLLGGSLTYKHVLGHELLRQLLISPHRVAH